MIEKRPEADRILIARLTGTARRLGGWRELTGDELAAAVAEVRELAAGRADLLAEVAGIEEGGSEGELSEPRGRQRRGCAGWLVPMRRRSPAELRRAGAGGSRRGCRRCPAGCMAREPGGGQAVDDG
jgi:hypothetical protein